jgi:hypothetical protein
MPLKLSGQPSIPSASLRRKGKLVRSISGWASNLGLSPLDGPEAAAIGYKRILANAQFPDVEIAFRESVFTRSTGPQLLDHVFSIDPANICSPFTPALGVQIASHSSL